RRPLVAAWLAEPEPWTDPARAVETIEGWAATIETDPPCGGWAIEPTDGSPIAGYVVLHRLPDGQMDIGWSLHPDAAGRGWASEAAGLLLERARGAGVERVHAVMWPHNEPSAAVARRIGMLDLGVIADPWYGTDDDPDSRVFVWEPPSRSGR
ncbi:MAG: GNAT family N-acetyltransferase, partial [Actinomycetota bacterium]